MRTPSPTGLVAMFLLAVTVAGCGGAGSPVDRTGSSDASPASSAAHRLTSAKTAPPTTRGPRPVDPDAHRNLIDRVRWGTTSKGRQLQVFPTHAGRTDIFPAAAKRAWAEVLADAPNAGTAGMYDQFRCHWNYARIVEPGKPSWNLEPWRPAVGYSATVAALCNPGGSEG